MSPQSPGQQLASVFPDTGQQPCVPARVGNLQPAGSTGAWGSWGSTSIREYERWFFKRTLRAKQMALELLERKLAAQHCSLTWELPLVLTANKRGIGWQEIETHSGSFKHPENLIIIQTESFEGLGVSPPNNSSDEAWPHSPVQELTGWVHIPKTEAHGTNSCPVPHERAFNLRLKASLWPVKKNKPFNQQFTLKSISTGSVEEQWIWKQHTSHFLQQPQEASSKEEKQRWS